MRTTGHTCWLHFPAQIARIEHYDVVMVVGVAAQVLAATTWDVALDGRRMGFQTYDDAQTVASMLVDPRFYGARQDWREHVGCEADFLALADEWLAQQMPTAASAHRPLYYPLTIADELS